MTKFYARINNGIVNEVIKIEDGEPSLSSRYHAALIENIMELNGPEINLVKAGWRYDGSGFSSVPPPPGIVIKKYVKVSTVRERLEAINKWADLVSLLQNDMPTLIKVLSLEDGIDPEDQQARDLISAIGADPEDILRI